jgi:hypothetical protein
MARCPPKRVKDRGQDGGVAGGEHDDLGPALTLRYLIPVDRLIPLPEGRKAVVTAVEVWGDEVVLRWRERAADDDRGHADLEWRMTDDAGTSFRRTGGGGQGSGERMDHHVSFSGRPNQGATVLLFDVGDERLSVPIR